MGSYVILAPYLIDAYRESLDRNIDSLHAWLIFWTAIVVFGLNLEFWAEFVGPLSNKLACNRKATKAWVHVYARFGILLVLAGVCGELSSEGQASSPEARLRALNESLVAGIQEQTARANERAAKAEAEISAAKLETAKAKLELLREIKRQGSRRPLLVGLWNDKRLLPFKGQLVEIWICPGLGDDEEIVYTWSQLWIELNKAEWSATQHGEQLACAGVGISLEILVDPHASERTKAAADALSLALASALLIKSPQKIRIHPFTASVVPSLGTPNTIAILVFKNVR